MVDSAPMPAPHRKVVRLAPIERKARPHPKAVSQDNRVHNRALLLQTLYRTGPMSRSDLARASQLTRPTVSALVAEFEAEGLVMELGLRAEPRVGKPATLLRIDDDATNVIALDLSHDDRLTGAVLNLRGRVIARAEIPAAGLVGQDAYRSVLALTQALREQSPNRVLGIGIATPGIVDDEGAVRYAAHLQWTDLPLAKRVSDKFGVPAFVGNDVKLEALAVYHFRSTGARDLIVISIQNGVGMGVMVGGRVVEGEHFAAGEIGHITVSDEGALCRCGRRGCLETFIAAAHAARRDGKVGTAHSEILRRAGRALGVAIAPIATALNLTTVILTGPPEILTEELVRSAAETADARTLPIINNSVNVVSMANETDLALLGAASLVLSRELGVM